MEPNKLDSILAIFDTLSHNEQVDLFLNVREGLLKQRECRIAGHKESSEIAHSNLESLAKGNEIILNPGNVPKIA